MYKIQVARVKLSNLISKSKFINTNQMSIHLFPVMHLYALHKYKKTVPVHYRDPPVAPPADDGRQVLTKSHLRAEIQPFFLHLLSTWYGNPRTIAYRLLQTTHIRESLQNHAEQCWLHGKQQLFPITGIFKID